MKALVLPTFLLIAATTAQAGIPEGELFGYRVGVPVNEQLQPDQNVRAGKCGWGEFGIGMWPQKADVPEDFAPADVCLAVSMISKTVYRIALFARYDNPDTPRNLADKYVQLISLMYPEFVEPRELVDDLRVFQKDGINVTVQVHTIGTAEWGLEISLSSTAMMGAAATERREWFLENADKTGL